MYTDGKESKPQFVQSLQSFNNMFRIRRVTRSLADFAVQSSPRELTNEEKIESALQAEDFNEALHQVII